MGGACRGAGWEAGKPRGVLTDGRSGARRGQTLQPARRALERAPPLRPDDDSACHSPLHRSCQDHHRGVECPISGGRAGWCQGGTYLAVSSIPRTFTTTRRSETVSAM